MIYNDIGNTKNNDNNDIAQYDNIYIMIVIILIIGRFAPFPSGDSVGSMSRVRRQRETMVGVNMVLAESLSIYLSIYIYIYIIIYIYIYTYIYIYIY